MQAASRLRNELNNIRKARTYGFFARPSNNDIFHWICQIYHSGYFYQLNMRFTPDYPIAAPVLAFEHSVYHPNIYANNTVCLDILSHKWRPTMTVMDILHGLAQLLEYPNPRSPANGPAADAFVHRKSEYGKKRDANNKKYWMHYRLMKE